MGRTALDLTGQRFTDLVVLRRRGTSTHGQAMWLCQCDCGSTHSVMSQSLRRGDTKRCPACTKKHHTHRGANRGVRNIVVELWFYTVGQGGGFATARNMNTGALITHSHNSRTPLRSQEAAHYPQMRNIAQRLAQMGLIKPRNPRHSFLRWYKDEGIEPIVHRISPRTKLEALWAECVASGTGPATIELERPEGERRVYAGTAAVVVDGVAMPANSH
jgi:hypothetical protein